MLMKNTVSICTTFVCLIGFTMFSMMSCKKDPDRKLTGTYIGTITYNYFEPRNPSPVVDTVYKNVTILVSEGSESSRKTTRLELVFNDDNIYTSYSENLNVENGVIKDTYTNRGAVGTLYRWNGTIESGVMNLTHRVEQYNGSLHEYKIEGFRL